MVLFKEPRNPQNTLAPGAHPGAHPTKNLKIKIILTFLIQIRESEDDLNFKILCGMGPRARILVQVTINRRLWIGRDGHLDQSKAYDLS